MNPRIRLTSAKVWVGVEVEAELGNDRHLLFYPFFVPECDFWRRWVPGGARKNDTGLPISNSCSLCLTIPQNKKILFPKPDVRLNNVQFSPGSAGRN